MIGLIWLLKPNIDQPHIIDSCTFDFHFAACELQGLWNFTVEANINDTHFTP